MLIWLLVGAILIAIALSNYFTEEQKDTGEDTSIPIPKSEATANTGKIKYREADEKTLRPMPEWTIIANSSNSKNRERMSYSLIIQAGNILEGIDVIPLSSLRMLMNEVPGLSKANFVLQILLAAADLYPTDEFLTNSYETSQARTHLATCIELILQSGGARALAKVAIASQGEPSF